ncbi:hypothetical protein ACIA8H_29935 [Streptomyces goshikiensis]
MSGAGERARLRRRSWLLGEAVADVADPAGSSGHRRPPRSG